MTKEGDIKMYRNERSGRWRVAVAIVCGMVFFIAAVPPQAAAEGEVGRYQVVAGAEENGFLVDTATGAVWILTYRTMPTGREPVAIPYTFIKISPKDGNQFLIENVKEATPVPRGK